MCKSTFIYNILAIEKKSNPQTRRRVFLKTPRPPRDPAAKYIKTEETQRRKTHKEGNLIWNRQSL